jgi:hypothetical protein
VNAVPGRSSSSSLEASCSRDGIGGKIQDQYLQKFVSGLLSG